MSPFFVLLRMRLRDHVRSRASFVFLFGLPLVLLSIVTLVFFRGHPFEERRVVVVGDAAVELPGVKVEHAALDAALGRLDGRMASAVLVGERVVVAERDEIFGRGLVAALKPPRTLELRALPRLGYVRYLLPGLVTFSVLIAGLFGVGWAMLRYRESLFLKKLATTTLSRSTFVAAQIVARALLVLLQVAVLLSVALPVLGLHPSGAVLALLALVVALGTLCFLGLGFALAALVRDEAILVDVISAATTPLVLLSEIFFPLDVLPGLLASVAALLPTTQMVRMVRALLLEGSSSGLGFGLALLAAWTVVTFGLALRSFRWT